MSRPSDSELPPFDEGEMGRLLSAERHAPGPDAEARERMWARLAPALPPPSRPLPRAAKLTLAVVALGLVGAALWWRAHPSTPVPRAAAPAAPETRAAIVTVSAPIAAPEITAPVPAVAPPVVERRRPARPRMTDTLAAEQRLVDEARAALHRGEPRAAEDALHEHARRFAEGQLREERESLLVRTELTLGRLADARARATSFLARDPDSLFAPIVRALDARARAALPDGP